MPKEATDSKKKKNVFSPPPPWYVKMYLELDAGKKKEKKTGRNKKM